MKNSDQNFLQLHLLDYSVIRISLLDDVSREFFNQKQAQKKVNSSSLKIRKEERGKAEKHENHKILSCSQNNNPLALETIVNK